MPKSFEGNRSTKSRKLRSSEHRLKQKTILFHFLWIYEFYSILLSIGNCSMNLILSIKKKYSTVFNCLEIWFQFCQTNRTTFATSCSHQISTTGSCHNKSRNYIMIRWKRRNAIKQNSKCDMNRMISQVYLSWCRLIPFKKFSLKEQPLLASVW